MSEMYELQLPELKIAPVEKLEPGLTFGQFMGSFYEFAHVQYHSDNPRISGNLWRYLMQVRPEGYVADGYGPLPDRLCSLTPEKWRQASSARTLEERWGDTALHSVALYGVLRVAHSKLAQKYNDLDVLGPYKNGRSSYIERAKGDIGTYLPKYDDFIARPRKLTRLGLVTATYAMNDHIERAQAEAADERQQFPSITLSVIENAQ